MHAQNRGIDPERTTTLNDHYRTSPTHLAPIVASLAIGLFCAWLVSATSLETIPVTPFPSDTVGAVETGLYFVILVSIGATLIYFLIKRKSLRLVTALTGFALTAAAFMLSAFYLFAAFAGIGIPYADLSAFAAAIVITIIADYSIFKGKQIIANVVVLGIGGALGTFLGFSIPTTATVLILCFLAIYDIYAVYRGPVGKIASSGLEQLKGLSFSFRDVQMGLGDLTFYSVLAGHMFIYFGTIPSVASVIGILIGAMLSFKMLEKRGMFPGLPIPIGLGLSAGLLTAFVLTI